MSDDPFHHGVLIPSAGHGVPDREAVAELAGLGFTDVWAAESDRGDAITPLAAVAATHPGLNIGTAIVSAFTRGPATLAQTAASLAQMAPGRFSLGIGSSSNVVVQGWNGIAFERSYYRMRDMVRFLKDAFTGEKVTREFETFESRGFRLGIVPEQTPPIYVAALREGMLRLAGREGDGVILNWLAAKDVPRVTEIVRTAAGGVAKPAVGVIFVCPSENTTVVREAARRFVTTYANVPVYAEYQRWLGRAADLEETWALWSGGNRAAAAAAVPDHVVDELIVHGSPEECRGRIEEYRQAGITHPALMVMPFDPELDSWEAIRLLGPSPRDRAEPGPSSRTGTA
ncbi:LLM class F420-dependent oxidoreductase [Streptomyces sp. NPDC051985]|uniref:LLM class F420-dependent oxidoreductase n=1 Tax=Streptomyces sp. NPDC051985 TaxID=3155807 RepID=UPI00341913D6